MVHVGKDHIDLVHNIQSSKKNIVTNKLSTFWGIIGIIGKGQPIAIKDLSKEIVFNRKIVNLEKILDIDKISNVKSVCNLTRNN